MTGLRYPWVLLLLLLVPWLAWLRFSPRRKPTYRFSDLGQFAQVRPSWAARLQPILPMLWALGIASLVMVLAQPRRGLRESIVKAEVVDIVLLLDLSTSMRAEDFSEGTRRMNRFDSAQEVLKEFIRSRKSDRMGMVAFAALPYTVSPLTLDHDWLLKRTDDLETGMLPDGTAIGTALSSAVNRLRESSATTKLVVLLTDGENNAGNISPENAAQAARALGIKVYTVGAGTDGWVPVPFTDRFGQVHYRRAWSEIDEATLREIALITGGSYFRATDHASLRKIYQEIDTLERTEIDVQQYTQYEPWFLPFLVCGLVCLGLEKALALTRLGRIP